MRCFFRRKYIYLVACAWLACAPLSVQAQSEWMVSDINSGIPAIAEWQAQMLQYGQQHCTQLGNTSLTSDARLALTYYDAQWVFQQMAGYTANPSWLDCANAARSIYRDQYVLIYDGRTPGYWNFTFGLAADYITTNNQTSKGALLLLAHNASYAVDSTPLAWTQDSTLSREVAYAIMSYLNSEAIGEPRRPRLYDLANQALDHINQWMVQGNAPWVRPFMVGLTSQALIYYYEKTMDPRVQPALTTAADWLWDHLWLESAGAFSYTDRQTSTGGTEPAPDLNLLIAPMYAWLYYQSGEVRFKERGDKIFAGGVNGAYLNGAKQFNQNYRWSFDFVRWRTTPRSAPIVTNPIPTPTPEVAPKPKPKYKKRKVCINRKIVRRGRHLTVRVCKIVRVKIKPRKK